LPATSDLVTPIAVAASYEELLEALRARVGALGITYPILDLAVGYAEGYTSKILGRSEYNASGRRRSKRHFSAESFDNYIAALGLKVALVEDPAGVARLKSFCAHRLLSREAPLRSVAPEPMVNIRVTKDFLRKIGKLGGQAFARNLHARAERREHMRRLALARWAKRSSTACPPA
jgi:hypothetical protein